MDNHDTENSERLVRETTTSPNFPRNVVFKAEDWGVPQPHGRGAYRGGMQDGEKRYDVVLALSVIKWVHLQHGDKGMCNMHLCIHTSLYIITERYIHLPFS